jgi:hypothetical protein
MLFPVQCSQEEEIWGRRIQWSGPYAADGAAHGARQAALPLGRLSGGRASAVQRRVRAPSCSRFAWCKASAQILGPCSACGCWHVDAGGGPPGPSLLCRDAASAGARRLPRSGSWIGCSTT